jgi:hypothetical protein
MYEILHEIAVFASATGLSIGMLIGCAAVWYFLGARPLAIAGAVTAAVGFGAFLYGEHDGRADITAQWNAANARVDAERKQRDADAAHASAADAAQAAADLKAGHNTNQEQVDALRKVDAVCHPIAGNQLR